MSTAATSLNFIDAPFDVSYLAQGNDPYKCPICLEHVSELGYWRGKDVFIVHEGQEGPKHPAHRECVRGWIRDNPTCPIGCGATISNKLISPLEVATHTFHEGSSAALKGAKAVENIYVFAAMAVASCAALILIGKWATRDTLAISGGGYGMAFLAGLYGRFVGNGAGADSRIESLAPIAATTGAIASLVPFFSRATQTAYFMQGLAIYGFAKSAGFTRTGLSASLGFATAAATRFLFRPEAWEKTLTILSGGVGAILGGIDSNKWINIVPALAGMSASWCTYEDYGPIGSAVIGAATSGMAKSIFSQAYGDRRHVG